MEAARLKRLMYNLREVSQWLLSMNILFSGQQLSRLERLHKFVEVVPLLRSMSYTASRIRFIKWTEAKAVVPPPPGTHRTMREINMYDPPGQRTSVFLYEGALSEKPLITACPAVMLVELYRRFNDIPEDSAWEMLGWSTAKEGF
jgi:hypothetical protein